MLCEDVNRVAVSFCSVVDRSPYPIERADITLETSDGGMLEFQIRPEWCRQNLDGELLAEQYLQKVHGTVSEEAHESEPPAAIF